MYYVVFDGLAISATEYKGKWKAFKTYNRQYATPLSRKHALAFALIGKGEVITEQDFNRYELKKDKSI